MATGNFLVHLYPKYSTRCPRFRGKAGQPGYVPSPPCRCRARRRGGCYREHPSLTCGCRLRCLVSGVIAVALPGNLLLLWKIMAGWDAKAADLSQRRFLPLKLCQNHRSARGSLTTLRSFVSEHRFRLEICF